MHISIAEEEVLISAGLRIIQKFGLTGTHLFPNLHCPEKGRKKLPTDTTHELSTHIVINKTLENTFAD